MQDGASNDHTVKIVRIFQILLLVKSRSDSGQSGDKPRIFGNDGQEIMAQLDDILLPGARLWTDFRSSPGSGWSGAPSVVDRRMTIISATGCYQSITMQCFLGRTSFPRKRCSGGGASGRRWGRNRPNHFSSRWLGFAGAVPGSGCALRAGAVFLVGSGSRGAEDLCCDFGTGIAR